MDQLELDQRAFVQRLPLLVNEADKLKLHVTARSLQRAQSDAGWELADILDRKTAKKRAAKEEAND